MAKPDLRQPVDAALPRQVIGEQRTVVTESACASCGFLRSVAAGQQLAVEDGRAGEPAQVDNLVAATRWLHELLMLKGRGDPELATRIDDLFAQIGETKMAYVYEQDIRALGDHCVLPLVRYIESDRSQTSSRSSKRSRSRRRRSRRCTKRSCATAGWWP